MAGKNGTKFIICNTVNDSITRSSFRLRVIDSDGSFLNAKFTLSIFDDCMRKLGSGKQIARGIFGNDYEMQLLNLKIPESCYDSYYDTSPKDSTITVICDAKNLMIETSTPPTDSTCPCINQTIPKPADSIYQLFMDDESLSDIQLILGEKKYYAHKVILAANSPVFQRMFSHQMQETLKKEVQIKEIEQKVLEELLKYIHARKINKLEELAGELLIAANRYEMKELKSSCERELVKKLTLKNVVSYLMMADTHNALSLKKHCFSIIMKNFNKVGELDGFKELGKTHANVFVELYQEMSSKCNVAMK